MDLCTSCKRELIADVNWASCRVRINRKSCKDCESAKHKIWFAENRDKAKISHRKHRLSKPTTHMLYEAKKRAVAANVPFDIVAEDITIPALCPVLGIPLAFSTTGKPGNGSPALDRIIPEKGYVPTNIMVISHRANSLKRDGSLEELSAIVEWLKQVTNSPPR